MSKEVNFLETHKNAIEHLGFWNEFYKDTILGSIELLHKTEIIRDFKAIDLIVNNDKILVKWAKRHMPLSDEELAENYGR